MKSKSYERNFISPNTLNSDLELFFTAEDVQIDDFSIIKPHWIMAHIMVEAGIFKSVSQARKNGWNKPIPDGFWMKNVGKNKTLITILNIKEEK